MFTYIYIQLTEFYTHFGLNNNSMKLTSQTTVLLVSLVTEFPGNGVNSHNLGNKLNSLDSCIQAIF